MASPRRKMRSRPTAGLTPKVKINRHFRRTFYMVPRIVLPFALLLTIPIAAGAQPTEPLDVKAKLNFHAKNSFAPMSLAGLAAYAAILQEANAPEEWKQGGAAYGKRFGTMVAWSGIHGVLAFGLLDAASGPALLPFGREGLLAPLETRVPRNHPRS